MAAEAVIPDVVLYLGSDGPTKIFAAASRLGLPVESMTPPPQHIWREMERQGVKAHRLYWIVRNAHELSWTVFQHEEPSDE